ncbi:DKNYY domain-containing protein [Aquimarina spinulae]|uniref:DKNYY domain-containing protein n=1 Tax=Aquimarina spinulae TaxID=1192023 RepID=UPI000D55536D|nr:DKNYY domain-containing protein [Aquimarina spinulae]
MIKKVLMILAAIFLLLITLGIYGVYRFLNPFGELVNKEKSESYFYTRDGDKIIHSPMGNWFSLGKTEMNVDFDTFQVLGREYAKDQNHVYYGAKLLDFDIDVPSFTVKFNYNIPMDKNHVYILYDRYDLEDGGGFKILEDADPATYEQLNFSFAKDKNYIFRDNEKLTEVDYSSFEILNEEFCRDNKGVYYYLYHEPLRKIETNLSEVTVLNQYCIRDDKYIYLHTSRRNGESVDEVVSIPFKNAERITFFDSNKIIKIDDMIYYETTPLKEADADTFEEVEYGYTKDINHVFFLGEIVKGADPKTFKYNSRNYTFSDKNYIYESGEVLKKSKSW